MAHLSEKDFERFVLLHRVGPKQTINVFEIGMLGKQIRIRHGARGKKLGSQNVKKQSLVEARNVFNDKRRQKIAEGYKVIREKPDPRVSKSGASMSNSNNNNSSNNNAIGSANANTSNTNNTANNNSGLRHFSFTFGQNRVLQSQQQRAKENLLNSGNISNNDTTNNNTNDSDNELTSNVSETSSVQRRKQQPPRRHHKPKKDGNVPNNKVNRRKKGRKVNNHQNNANNANNKNKNGKKGKNKNNKNKNKGKNNNSNNLVANGHRITNGKAISSSVTNTNTNTNDYDSTDGDGSNDEEEEDIDTTNTDTNTNTNTTTNNANTNTYETETNEDNEEEYESDNNENSSEYQDESVEQSPYMNGGNGRRAANNKHHNNRRASGTGEDEEEEDGSTTQNDEESGSDSSSSSSSSSGRSSDDEYEMEYEKMAKIMADIVSREPPKKLIWKPLSMWIRYNEEIDYCAEWALAPMPRRIAGSCHELLVAYLRSSKGEFLTRLIKLARDPDEDNKYHFETERKVSQYLTKMAKVVNKSFHTRNDVCIWPVETIYFEYEDEMKWATVQAPFLPKDNYVFVKIEPNYGKPCVNDAIVGRYQHAFAAISKGLDLVRDWQGYGVSQKTFLKQCEITNVKEAVEQIIQRKNGNDSKTQVLVVIDPVLTTCTAHFETNNPTDFGMKAIDEWLETHDCVKCRCNNFYLNKELRFGIADPNQHWFDFENAPKYLEVLVKKCRKDLGTFWNHINDGWTPPNIFDEIDKNELESLGIDMNSDNSNSNSKSKSGKNRIRKNDIDNEMKENEKSENSGSSSNMNVMNGISGINGINGMNGASKHSGNDTTVVSVGNGSVVGGVRET